MAENPELIKSKVRGLTWENGSLFFRGMPVEAMRSYPLGVAAALLGIGYTSFWKLVKLGRIRVDGRRVFRSELDRYEQEYGLLKK